MTERTLATVKDYDGLLAVLRDSTAELKLTHENLDHVAGLQSNYASKLFAPVPLKSLGRMSFGPVLQALGLKLVIVEDKETLARYASQRVERKKPIRGGGTNEVINFSVSRRRLGMLARKGGRARAEKMTPEQRSDSARKAVLARWQYRREKLARRREREAANG